VPRPSSSRDESALPTAAALGLLLLLLQAPSLRAVFKYTAHPWLVAAALWAAAAAAYALLLKRTGPGAAIERVLSTRLTAFVIIGAILYATWRIYPYADALKLQGQGSTADDALLVPLRTWLAGRPLYSGRLMGGVATSPGPGWIFVNAPFTLTRGYFLLTAFYVSLLWNAIERTRRSVSDANLMLVLVVSSLAFWELTVTGHDVIATSCAIGALLLWTERAFTRRSAARVALVALGWGTLATARILYPFLIPLAGLLLAKWDRRLAAIFVVVGLVVTALWHLPFVLTNRPYDPFHLWDRARGAMGPWLLLAGALATLLAGGLAWSRARPTRRSLLGWFMVCFLVPLLFLSAGELIAVQGRLARWEGANYLLPVLGTALAFLCMERAPRTAPPRPFPAAEAVTTRRDA
jgi:hypothetical protein